MSTKPGIYLDQVGPTHAMNRALVLQIQSRERKRTTKAGDVAEPDDRDSLWASAVAAGFDLCDEIVAAKARPCTGCRRAILGTETTKYSEGKPYCPTCTAPKSRFIGGLNFWIAENARIAERERAATQGNLEHLAGAGRMCAEEYWVTTNVRNAARERRDAWQLAETLRAQGCTVSLTCRRCNRKLNEGEQHQCADRITGILRSDEIQCYRAYYKGYLFGEITFLFSAQSPKLGGRWFRARLDDVERWSNANLVQPPLEFQDPTLTVHPEGATEKVSYRCSHCKRHTKMAPHKPGCPEATAPAASAEPSAAASPSVPAPQPPEPASDVVSSPLPAGWTAVPGVKWDCQVRRLDSTPREPS